MIIKVALWGIVLWLTILILAVNVAQAETRAKDIEARLPLAIPTFCATDAEWSDPTYNPFGALAAGFTNTTTWQIHLSPSVCYGLRAGVRNERFAQVASTLYHEYIHAALRDSNEGDAECYSLFAYRFLLRKYWGIGKSLAQRLYTFAWRSHVRRGAFFPQYKGTCAFEKRDPLAEV